MVDIKIFDVDHGFCAAISTDEHHTILLDCGYSFRTGFRPVRYLINHHSRHIDYLIIPAYAKESLASFSDVNSHFIERYFSADYLITNPSISVSSIEELILQNPDTLQDLSLLGEVKHGRRNIDQPIQ